NGSSASPIAIPQKARTGLVRARHACPYQLAGKATGSIPLLLCIDLAKTEKGEPHELGYSYAFFVWVFSSLMRAFTLFSRRLRRRRISRSRSRCILPLTSSLVVCP